MTLMGKIAYTASIAFIAGILTLVAVHFLAPDDSETGPFVIPATAAAAAPSTAPPGATTQPSQTATPQSSGITLAQIAQHNSTSSCWLAIDGAVYDVTTYLSRHPAPSEVLNSWCGQEATQAWEDKGGEDESHSSRAEALLDGYKIGDLAQ